MAQPAVGVQRSPYRPECRVERARLKRCAICDGLFLYCAKHGLRRYRFCSSACAATGAKAREHKARKAYRATPEGKAQRADEERRRRQRQHDSVGDRCGPAEPELVKCALPPPPARPDPERPAEPVAFRVEVPRELARVARQLCARRQELACVACGRRGYVAAVVVRSRDRRATAGRGPRPAGARPTARAGPARGARPA